jgi:serine/threonine protein kinase
MYRTAHSSAPSGSRIPQTFHQVTVAWKHLTHPNIVPLLGATVDPPQLISDRMPGGDLTEYISTHPDTDRTSLVSDVSASLYELLTPSLAV